MQVKLNTDESPTVATEYGIRSIPTVMVFKNGASNPVFEWCDFHLPGLLFCHLDLTFSSFYTCRPKDGRSYWRRAQVDARTDHREVPGVNGLVAVLVCIAEWAHFYSACCAAAFLECFTMCVLYENRAIVCRGQFLNTVRLLLPVISQCFNLSWDEEL